MDDTKITGAPTAGWLKVDDGGVIRFINLATIAQVTWPSGGEAGSDHVVVDYIGGTSATFTGAAALSLAKFLDGKGA
jgi:hypothetical protein